MSVSNFKAPLNTPPYKVRHDERELCSHDYPIHVNCVVINKKYT